MSLEGNFFYRSVKKLFVFMISLKPRTILGIKIHEELAWSSNPGCFENHLLRKHNNQHLFAGHKRTTQQDIDKAIQKDNDDLYEFDNRLEEFGSFLSTNWAEDIEALKARVDKLLKRSREIGGKALDMGDSLNNFNEELLKIEEKNFFESKDKHDEETIKRLESIRAAQDYMRNVMNDFYMPFIIQLHREDTPIKDEELPASVLAEDIETVKIFSKYSIRNNREISFKIAMNNLANNLKNKGISAPILEKLNIINAIPGATVFEGLIWSSKPSCFEKQLQRQVNNPLFPKKLRKITQSDVENARKRDLVDIDKFKIEVEYFESLFKELFKSPDVAFGEILTLHKQIFNYVSLAHAIGGEAIEYLPGLRELRSTATNVLKNSAKCAEDHELREKVAKTEFPDESFVSNEFISQVCRDDSPITPTLVFSLLSEKIDSMRLICELLSEDQLFLAKTDAVKIVKNMLSRGENSPMIKEKLIALGVPTCIVANL